MFTSNSNIDFVDSWHLGDANLVFIFDKQILLSNLNLPTNSSKMLLTTYENFRDGKKSQFRMK